MTRAELLKILIARARTNGFEFRRWYTTRIGLPWISAEAALALLDQQRRYYALLFSHEFAVAFWKSGEDVVFAIPAQNFQRVLPDGSTRIVKRKTHMRRSARRDAWLYHLRQMAAAEEPLRYLRKYLYIEDELEPEPAADAKPNPSPADAATVPQPEAKKVKLTDRPVLPASLNERRMRGKPIARPLPTDLPAFMRRPPPSQ